MKVLGTYFSFAGEDAVLCVECVPYSHFQLCTEYGYFTVLTSRANESYKELPIHI